MKALAAATAASFIMILASGTAETLLSCDLSAKDQEEAMLLIYDYIYTQIDEKTLFRDLEAIAPVDCFESTAIDHPLGEAVFEVAPR